jgi:predicted RNase H-like HicB family nuclease
MNAIVKDLEYYLSLSYPILLIPDPDDGGWYAKIPPLPGCMSDGTTIAEAVENVNEAKALWLEVALEEDDEIPEPGTLDELLASPDTRHAA